MREITSWYVVSDSHSNGYSTYHTTEYAIINNDNIEWTFSLSEATKITQDEDINEYINTLRNKFGNYNLEINLVETTIRSLPL